MQTHFCVLNHHVVSIDSQYSTHCVISIKICTHNFYPIRLLQRCPKFLSAKVAQKVYRLDKCQNNTIDSIDVYRRK